MQNITNMKVIVECQEFKVTIAWDESASNLTVADVKQRAIVMIRQARAAAPPHRESDLALDSMCLQYEYNTYIQYQYGSVTNDVREHCASVAYKWGVSITPQDTAIEQQRWLASEGATIDLHSWTGPSATTDCRAAAIKIVQAAAAARSAAVETAAPAAPVASALSVGSVAAAPPHAPDSIDYIEADGEEIFEVQEIMDICVKTTRKAPQLFYKVWWKGYPKPRPDCNASWEPETNLSTSLVQRWNQEHAAAYQAAKQDIEHRKAKPKAIIDPSTAPAVSSHTRTGRMLTPNPKFN